MGCCGQGRRELRATLSASPRPASAWPRLRGRRQVVLLGEAAVLVTGAVSGRCYLFGGPGEAVEVDERDVPALLADGWFAEA